MRAMYPQQPPYQPQTPPPAPSPQPPQYSIDYLNQIAPQTPRKQPNKLFAIIGIGAILLVLVIVMIGFAQLGSAPSKNLQTLATRLTSIQDIAEKSRTNIKSNQLRGTNSSLVLFLTNANRDIAAPLAKNGVDVKKLDKSIVAKDKASSDKVRARLEDARLNALFDRTYAREMSYQLNTTLLLMDEIEKSTNSKSLDAFLTTTKGNLEPIKTQLSEFKDTAN